MLLRSLQEVSKKPQDYNILKRLDRQLRNARVSMHRAFNTSSRHLRLIILRGNHPQLQLRGGAMERLNVFLEEFSTFEEARD